MNRFSFEPIPPRAWSGRYGRIPGDTTALHVKRINGSPKVVVFWHTGEGTCACNAVVGHHERSLADAVIKAKRAMGGKMGGSFQINEFGQVLVPATDGAGQRMLAGRALGSLRFEDPLNGGTFTLGDDSGLSTGDSWRLPYLGIPHNLSRRSKLYFWREDGERGETEEPPRQDSKLVSALRSIRRSGPMRFIVNPEGVILTKKSGKLEAWNPNQDWDPIYVGQVNLKAWFEMEE